MSTSTSDEQETVTEEFDFTPQFEEAEAGEPTAELQASAEEEVTEEQEDSTTPRAQKRIRQLAGERKELKEKQEQLTRQNEELLALVEQLKRSNELQERQWEKQNEWLGQQEQAGKAQQRRQLMLQYGLNPDDTRDAIAFEQMEYKAQLEQQLNTIKERMEQQQHALQVERFNVALDQSLSRELKSYDVDDEVQAYIRDTAYDIASIRGLTAKEAAAEAVKRYRKALPTRKAKRAPAKVDAAAKVVKTGGSSASAPSTSSDLDFLSMLDSGKFRF